MYANCTELDGWSHAEIISDNTSSWNTGHSYHPSMAIDWNGIIHVVWSDDTPGLWGSDREIMYSNHTNGIGWSNPIVISDNGGWWNNNYSAHPEIAIDNNGAIHVVWWDQTWGIWGKDIEIMYVNYSVATGWSNVTVISDGYGGSYWNQGDSLMPAIAIDNESNTIHIVWEDSTNGAWGTDSEIMYVNFTIANGWSNATVISDDLNGWNNGSSLSPAIAVDSSNDTIYISWDDDTDGVWGSDFEIMFRSNTLGVGWSNVTIISDGVGGFYWNDGDSRFSSIAVDGAGRVHVTWGDHTDGIWGTDGDIMYTSYSNATGWFNITI